MDFDEIAERQGWNERSIIFVLRAFITSQGLGDALDRFAEAQADEEENESCDPLCASRVPFGECTCGRVDRQLARQKRLETE